MRFLKKTASFMTAAILSFSAFGTLGIESMVSEAAANTTIVNDTFWKDTNGNNIYSQGGGVFKFGDTYYWYGVHYSGAETYASTLKKIMTGDLFPFPVILPKIWLTGNLKTTS